MSKKTVRTFISEVAKKYDIDETDLTNMWNDVSTSVPKTTRSTKKVKLCDFVLTRGARIGEKCGKSCKGEDTRCTSHSRRQRSLREPSDEEKRRLKVIDIIRDIKIDD